ncbi:MAG TPA: hypothetical protein VNO81_11625, partial [Candidatus Nitrosotenuis sp.]|nr:hypothetical protein [Candidatus Nitrosotenuis sp.]
DRLKLDAGATVTGAWSNHRALDFLANDVKGVRPGGYLEAEYVGKHVRPFFRVDVGGIRDEPVYRVGISIPLGRGDRPWVDSPWK